MAEGRHNPTYYASDENCPKAVGAKLNAYGVVQKSIKYRMSGKHMKFV